MLTKLLIIFILIVFRIHVHAEDSNTTATFLAEKPDPNSNTYILNMKDPYIAKLKDINLENGELKYKIFHKNAESEVVGFYTYENNIVIRQVDKTIGAIRIYENTKTAMGGNIWVDDYEKIKMKYGGKYLKKKSFWFFLYVICKLLKGYYFKMLIFSNKNKGLEISTITIKK